MVDVVCSRNKELGLWEATATIQLPPITVTRMKADKSDLKYEFRRAFSEIVEEVVEKACDEDF
tara:strand:+ start:262 stop:450 length:189 start_codon:yes stop_codon:yes gene_type:complete